MTHHLSKLSIWLTWYALFSVFCFYVMVPLTAIGKSHPKSHGHTDKCAYVIPYKGAVSKPINQSNSVTIDKSITHNNWPNERTSSLNSDTQSSLIPYILHTKCAIFSDDYFTLDSLLSYCNKQLPWCGAVDGIAAAGVHRCKCLPHGYLVGTHRRYRYAGSMVRDRL